ncbi:MAG: cache domain-containing protein, partial [Ignavibacteria bacterium]|nr:cache domain-containing protein [Ignavibacteria bacterium]
LSAILGWVFDIAQLASFGSDKIPMALNTAVLFAAYGLIILFYRRLSSSQISLRIAIAFSYFGVFFALLMLYLSLNGIRLCAEHLGITLSGGVDGLVVGHMSPVTAFCFLLTGLACLIFLVLKDRKKLNSIVLLLPGALILISIIFLLSYLFGTPLLYGGSFIPPALPTTSAFLFLGIALLFILGLRVWEYDDLAEALNTRQTFILALIFIVLVVSITTVGYSYYKSYEKHYRMDIENQLSSIADLKISELVQWWKERLGDAEVFYKNAEFSGIVKRYIDNPNDSDAKKRIQDWIGQVRSAYNYNSICIHNANGTEVISTSNEQILKPFIFSVRSAEVLKSGKIVFEDFYRDENDKRVYLTIFIPILSEKNIKNVIGVVALRIDPEQYLYPLTNGWPTPSKTAETLIIRREGNEAVYLNELRFHKNSALNLRSPLTNTNLPAVQAALGRKGIFEGVDYRGVPVIAYVCPIP